MKYAVWVYNKKLRQDRKDDYDMNKQNVVYRMARGLYRLYKRPIVAMNKKKIQESAPYVSAMHNIHVGQRCFIIGNGPSLKAADLTRLKEAGEFTFGCNRIYEIYDQTEWRPTYYCIQDRTLLKKSKEDIDNKVKQKRFIVLSLRQSYPQLEDAVYFQLTAGFDNEFPKFSENVLDGIYHGITVTYMCMQLAVYMGFKEIYLLGVDHNYAKMIDQNGKLVCQEGVTDHFSAKDTSDNIPRLNETTLAYRSAKRYADTHGIKIYNATRGGKLEVFERVDFDTIIP